MTSERAAVEYEFYIPAAVWEHEATRAFLARVTAALEGATVFTGAVGAWEGQVERTHVVRVISPREMERLVIESAEELMKMWGPAQEALMFTAREVVVREVK